MGNGAMGYRGYGPHGQWAYGQCGDRGKGVQGI